MENLSNQIQVRQIYEPYLLLITACVCIIATLLSNTRTSMQGNEYGQLMMSLVDDAYPCDDVIFYQQCEANTRKVNTSDRC